MCRMQRAILRSIDRLRKTMIRRTAPIFRGGMAYPSARYQRMQLPVAGGIRKGPCNYCKARILYLIFQIRSLYSAMVRSEAKMPEQAVLVIAIFSHFSRF